MAANTSQPTAAARTHLGQPGRPQPINEANALHTAVNASLRRVQQLKTDSGLAQVLFFVSAPQSSA
jgi:hypothetical protein